MLYTAHADLQASRRDPAPRGLALHPLPPAHHPGLPALLMHPHPLVCSADDRLGWTEGQAQDRMHGRCTRSRMALLPRCEHSELRSFLRKSSRQDDVPYTNNVQKTQNYIELLLPSSPLAQSFRLTSLMMPCVLCVCRLSDCISPAHSLGHGHHDRGVDDHTVSQS